VLKKNSLTLHQLVKEILLSSCF